MVENIAEYIRQIREMVADRLDLTHNVEDDEIRQTIADIIAEESSRRYLTLTEKKEIMEGVFNSMRGLDVLQPLVDDPSITEIMINGPHNVFVEQSGRLYKKDVSFGTNEKLENVIINIVSRVNRTVNEAQDLRMAPASTLSFRRSRWTGRQ